MSTGFKHTHAQQPALHANFRLASDGEYLALSGNKSRRFLDEDILPYPPQTEEYEHRAGMSAARASDARKKSGALGRFGDGGCENKSSASGHFLTGDRAGRLSFRFSGRTRASAFSV